MKKVLIGVVFSLMTTCIIGQTSQSDYFPHGIGDRWEFRDAFDWRIEEILTIEKDSLDPHGSIFLKYIEKPDYTVRIDTNSFVGEWDYFFDEVTHRWYKLDGQIGERWVVRKATIARDTLWAEIKDIYQGQLFNHTTNIMVVEYWYQSAPGDSFWISNRWLAEGFGLFDSFTEPGTRVLLAGAIIDGVRYGQLTNLKPMNETGLQNFDLEQNFPNPFNPVTTISFTIDKSGEYSLSIFDVNGTEVNTLLHKELSPGSKSVTWNGLNQFGNPVSSGIYFYQLQNHDHSQIRKMILLK